MERNIIELNIKYMFENGYGASVIRNSDTKKLYEVAVLNEDYTVTYNTCITNDFIPCITFGGVLECLEKIKKLKKRDGDFDE